ncbi:Manganese/iron superoxide dismutase [Desulfamplus magnetovallimortis]|uniref:Superoxide dismutase n=1 Tax=Desulfamplus magnetovallimortis TaxID=1246637 RepID=A0A1W1H8Y9_9BACT|nr:superoxide dismutase [Desulfamplus magnetovallimortis]SLM28947.1 Manganese/iron superoxide dismutase [Desulfamplus magnetovallimortis]
MNNHVRKKIVKGASLLMMIVICLFLPNCAGEEDNLYSQMKLPYALDALEPIISKKAMLLHYYKHHAGYVAKTNQILKEKGLTITSPIALLQEINGNENYKSLFNALAQAWNHSFYWQCLKPNSGNIPAGKLRDLINESFGNVAAFREQFVSAATSQFGSGWVWLVKENDRLAILTTGNADTPVAHGIKPLLVLDVWEHAYYLDYQNRRKEFVESVLDNLVNWAFVQEQLVSNEEGTLKKKMNKRA